MRQAVAPVLQTGLVACHEPLKPCHADVDVDTMCNGAFRSVDAALRRSIPAFNKDVKEVQARLEDVAFKLRIPQRKPWQGMADNIAASQAIAQQPDKVQQQALLLNTAKPEQYLPHNWVCLDVR